MEEIAHLKGRGLITAGALRLPVHRSAATAQHRFLAWAAAAVCFLAFVDGAVPQAQMYLLGGQVLFGNSLLKAGLLTSVALGCVLHPRIRATGFPLRIWMISIGFLIIEVAYLVFGCGMSPRDVMISYYDYYFLLLMGPLLLVFRGAVSERVLIRSVLMLFTICAGLAFAQHLTSSPILYTESTDGSFKVASWEFIGEVRAFSLFGSGLEFGFFCAFTGALGVALMKTMRCRGFLLWVASGFACYTTLTRLCYLIFFCASVYSFTLTFGKKPTRGRWHPSIFFLLGLATIAISVANFTSGEANKLEDGGSIFQRLEQWSFYADLLQHSTFGHQMFGVGIVQNENILPLFPMIIDNTFLAIILHIGVIGLVVVGGLVIRMWFYLRRKAISTQQPFIIAATSLWATMLCASMFNIVLTIFGTVFALAVLCEEKRSAPALMPD